MRGGALKMQELTRVSMRWSTPARVARDERMVKISDHDQRKGTVKLRPLEPPLLDSLLHDDEINEALFLDHSLELGVVSNDGAVTNSGEIPRCVLVPR
jgi:hypothetical protein